MPIDEDVGFASYSEIRGIDSRLNRERGVIDELTSVMGFIVIHVGSWAVGRDIDCDVVPGPVNEILAISSIFDDFACRIIDFIAFHAAMRKFFLQKRNSGITSFFHNGEAIWKDFRNYIAYITHPGDVGVDAFGIIELCPHID